MSEESKVPEIQFDIDENSRNTNMSRVNDGTGENLIQIKNKSSKLSLLRMMTKNKTRNEDFESNDYNPHTYNTNTPNLTGVMSRDTSLS
jgi:hypothetical protein